MTAEGFLIADTPNSRVRFATPTSAPRGAGGTSGSGDPAGADFALVVCDALATG